MDVGDIRPVEATGTVSTPVRVAQNLFFINAVIWITLSALSLYRLIQKPPEQSWVIIGIGILMFGNAGAMALSGILIATLRKSYLYMAVGVLAVNILLTVTDQFGILDLFTLSIDVILLGLLYLTRRTYSR